MIAARMVARLTGPWPVRLVAWSSRKLRSRTFSGGPPSCRMTLHWRLLGWVLRRVSSGVVLVAGSCSCFPAESGFGMRAFRVRLPSGVGYWTVLDEELAVVPVADAFLRHVRFGREGAESTTKAY